jgi:double-stranded RNA-binding protein Staufen
MGVKYSAQTTAAIAKELLDTGASPTAESISKTSEASAAAAQQAAVRPKQQLLYLADVLGFKVQFTDFPKGSNKSEFLSLVSLSTTPPQVSHGAGATIEDSHDVAALTALKALTEVGLDAVTAPGGAGENGAIGAGDGPHVTEEKHANSVADTKKAETQ